MSTEKTNTVSYLEDSILKLLRCYRSFGTLLKYSGCQHLRSSDGLLLCRTMRYRFDCHTRSEQHPDVASELHISGKRAE